MRVVAWTFILRVLGSEFLSQALGPQQGPCGPLALAPQGHFPILDASPVAQGTWHSDWLGLGGVFHPKAVFWNLTLSLEKEWSPNQPWRLFPEGRGKGMGNVRDPSHCPWFLHGAYHTVIHLG